MCSVGVAQYKKRSPVTPASAALRDAFEHTLRPEYGVLRGTCAAADSCYYRRTRGRRVSSGSSPLHKHDPSVIVSREKTDVRRNESQKKKTQPVSARNEKKEGYYSQLRRGITISAFRIQMSSLRRDLSRLNNRRPWSHGFRGKPFFNNSQTLQNAYGVRLKLSNVSRTEFRRVSLLQSSKINKQYFLYIYIYYSLFMSRVPILHSVCIIHQCFSTWGP